jgi:hypothetical protein
MSEIKKVLITVKTYPTISKKYDELVCTAGVLEDGTWIRIYPLPFRKLDYENRYKKYQWIELPLEKNTGDPRPESYRPTNIDKIKMLNYVDTKNNWEERKRIIFEKTKVFTNIDELINKARDNELSLAVFKPKHIVDFLFEEVDREWSKEKLDLLKIKSQQLSLFQTPEEVKREFSVVKKIPYKFSYQFSDDADKKSTMMIMDWEIGMLYWNCLKAANNSEDLALKKVKQKYLEEFSKKDIFLFLGTTKQFHSWAKNPFVIIGVFYPNVIKKMIKDLE